jgi:hypothetical protein
MNALHIKKARRLASPIKNAFGLHRVIGKRVCTSGLYLSKNSRKVNNLDVIKLE